jgi:hypothetical protein
MIDSIHHTYREKEREREGKRERKREREGGRERNIEREEKTRVEIISHLTS